ncbi:hypothetical protein TSAR_005952 [Trichomalopsis sarcophagae]|uniref:Uncharacterized protein n=1 Tax=Trichomalopsis sarcophagae TaxID=543379 RepID=A0A232FEE7_9HYME|nr:hypothetical protein TSAR_005952 [Trichomalopsis sarcophagae]
MELASWKKIPAEFSVAKFHRRALDFPAGKSAQALCSINQLAARNRVYSRKRAAGFSNPLSARSARHTCHKSLNRCFRSLIIFSKGRTDGRRQPLVFSLTGSIFREVLLKLGTMALPIFRSANLSMVIVGDSRELYCP